MKNFIQGLFKKIRYREKQVFLLSNIIILVMVMAVIWGSYNIDDGSITFPPNANANVFDFNTKPTETVDSIECTIAHTEETIIYTEPSTDISESGDIWPKYHFVEEGDTWYSLCMGYFGTDEYADAIAYDNGKTIADYIFVAEELKIESEEHLIQLTEEIKASRFNDENYIFNKGSFGYKYGERSNPAIDIIVSKDCQGKNHTEEVDTSTFEYVGNHVITGYDPYCTHCCSGTGLMASGNYAINGYSVAASYPLGTTLYIEGYGFYMVEDRGVSGKHIDIAAPSHEACYAITNNSVAVYIVPNNN